MWNTAVVQGSELGLITGQTVWKKSVGTQMFVSLGPCCDSWSCLSTFLSLNSTPPWDWWKTPEAGWQRAELQETRDACPEEPSDWSGSSSNRTNGIRTEGTFSLSYLLLEIYSGVLGRGRRRTGLHCLTLFTNTLEPPFTALISSRDEGALCKSSPSRFVSPGSAESSRQRQVGTEWRLWQKTFSPSSSPF